MALDDRKLEVLRAIVEDYVATQEPVGSKALVERHNLRRLARRPCATTWPCWRRRATSASRTPAPAGCPPTRATGSSSTGCPGSSRSPRPSAGRSSGSWSARSTSTTWCTARSGCWRSSPGRSPSCSTRAWPAAAVRHLELVPISTTRLMLVMITDTGRVEQRLVELPGPIDADDVDRAAPADQRAARRPAARRDHRRWCRRCVEQVRAELRRSDDRAGHRAAGDAGRAHRGAHRAGRHRQPDPRRHARLLRHASGRSWRRSRRRSSCSSCSARPSQSLTRVRIGDENEIEDLRADLGGDAPDTARATPSWAGWACSGPTRMDYPGTIATVRAVARYVGEVLAQN